MNTNTSNNPDDPSGNPLLNIENKHDNAPWSNVHEARADYNKPHDGHYAHHDNEQPHLLNQIFNKLCKLVDEQKHEKEWFKSHTLVTKQDLKQLQDKIMSKVSEFAARQNEANDRIDVAMTGLTGDVQSLNDLIVTLQGTQGEISAEDQGLLDQIQVRATEIVTKLEALDALTAPVTGSV